MIRAILLALMLTGCASPTSQFLDDRTAMISGRGGAARTGAQIMKDVLVKAAMLGRERGYSHFQIIDRTDASRYVLLGNRSGITGVTMPGTDIMVRFFHADEIPGQSGIWSVESVLAETSRK